MATILATLAIPSLLIWIYLTLGRGFFWQADQTLRDDADDPDRWPAVVALVFQIVTGGQVPIFLASSFAEEPKPITIGGLVFKPGADWTSLEPSNSMRAAELETRNAFRGVKTDIAQVRALGRSLESGEGLDF